MLGKLGRDILIMTGAGLFSLQVGAQNIKDSTQQKIASEIQEIDISEQDTTKHLQKPFPFPFPEDSIHIPSWAEKEYNINCDCIQRNTFDEQGRSKIVRPDTVYYERFRKLLPTLNIHHETGAEVNDPLLGMQSIKPENESFVYTSNGEKFEIHTKGATLLDFNIIKRNLFVSEFQDLESYLTDNELSQIEKIIDSRLQKEQKQNTYDNRKEIYEKIKKAIKEQHDQLVEKSNKENILLDEHDDTFFVFYVKVDNLLYRLATGTYTNFAASNHDMAEFLLELAKKANAIKYGEEDYEKNKEINITDYAKFVHTIE